MTIMCYLGCVQLTANKLLIESLGTSEREREKEGERVGEQDFRFLFHFLLTQLVNNLFAESHCRSITRKPVAYFNITDQDIANSLEKPQHTKFS